MKIYRILNISLTLLFIFQPMGVYAQELEVTSSGSVSEVTLTPTLMPIPISEASIISPAPSVPSWPEIKDQPKLDPTPTGEWYEEATPAAAAIRGLTMDREFESSAQVRKLVRVLNLAKRDYRAGDYVSVVVENANTNELELSLFGTDGSKADVDIEEISTENPAVVRIRQGNSFTPGRYRLKVVDGSGNVTTQDFNWGVLALNTDKSIYAPGDEAQIQMAVLDETGSMVCDADVELQITSPKSQISTLGTKDGTIKVNDECELKDFTLIPDYEASVNFADVGVYEMKLTAKTSNGEHSITDAVEVRDKLPFDIERDSATRLYPKATYPMLMTIKANEDFEGVITDTVPEVFEISNLEGARQPDEVATKPQGDVKGDSIEAAIFNLALPFDGQYDITQDFGGVHRDPTLKKKYSDYGVIGHDGLDFELPYGTEVLSVEDGIVRRARENYDYGTTIVIEHGWGKSYYGHLSELLVKEGDRVAKGQVIGKSGNSGLSLGSHLHFGVKPNVTDLQNGFFGKIDPMPFLAKRSWEEVLVQVLGESSLADDKEKILSWKVNMKKGEEIKIGYSYDVPDISPQFYLAGPLKLSDKCQETSDKCDGGLAFAEARQWQLAVDAVDNNGNIYYGDAANDGDLNFRTYTHTATVGNETTSVTTSAGNITWVRAVASPTRDEKFVTQLKDDGRLDVLTCTGGCDAAGDWSLIATYSTATTAGGSDKRAFDIVYEQLSGDAMIMFTDDNTVGKVYYCIWNGSSWSPATECGSTFTPDDDNALDIGTLVGVSEQPEWIRIVPRGSRLTANRNDEFLVGVADANDDLYLGHWTGSAFNHAANPTDTLSVQDIAKFDMAWEETTGDGLAVFTDTTVGQTNLSYSIYTNGSGWGAAQTDGPANNGGQSFLIWVEMASDPRSDDISIFSQDNGDAEWFIWNGSSFLEGADDTLVEAGAGKHFATAWTRFSQRAVFIYTDSNALTSDMECWTSGGGFSGVVSDIGNANISNTNDVEDNVLVPSFNNNRMLLTRHDIDDDLFGLTYDDATGCADGDWVALNSGSVFNGEIETDAAGGSNTSVLVHGSTYTPYSPWSLNWRFYDDETSDDPSTGLNSAAENTTPTGVDQEEFIRLRINMAERGGMGQTDTRKKLQYVAGSVSCTPNTVENDTDCSWTDVGDTSETSAVWRYATAAETCTACTDGNTSNTPRLTATTTGDPEVFYVSDKDGAHDTDFDHTALTVKEIDFPLKAEDVANSTTYYFRLYEPRISDNGQDSPVYREQDNDGNNDCATSTCTYPSLTTSAGGAATPTLDQLMRHGNWFSSGVEQPFTF